MAMRPPVPVPTLSRRAKLVIGAIVVLLVLFTAIGTLTNVYVDYLWFAETHYTEVFWTELQTRVAAVRRRRRRRSAGWSRWPIYLAYRFRPTFRPMSLEQQNLERYRQSLEPRRALVLIGVGVVVGPVRRLRRAGQLADLAAVRATAPTSAPRTRSSASTCRSSSSTTRSTGWCWASLFAIGGARADRLAAHALRLRRPAAADAGAEAHPGGAGAALGAPRRLRAAQGGRLLAGPVRPGLLRPRPGVHRRELHRRQRAAGAQDDPGVRRGGLRAGLLRQHRLPQLPAAGRRAGAAAAVQPGDRRGLPGDRAAVRGQAQRRPEGGALHPAGHLLDAGRLRPLRRSTTSTTRSRHTGNTVDTERRPGRAAQRHRRRSRTPGCWTPTCCRETFTARQQIRNVYGFPQKLDIDRYTVDGQVPGLRRGRPRARQRTACRATRPTGSTGTPSTRTATASSPPRPTRCVAGQEGGEPNFTTRRPADRPATSRSSRPRIYYGELNLRARTTTRSSARRRARRPASSTGPRTATATGRSTTPTTARAASRSAASSAS